MGTCRQCAAGGNGAKPVEKNSGTVIGDGGLLRKNINYSQERGEMLLFGHYGEFEKEV